MQIPHSTVVKYDLKLCIKLALGANFIELFTAVSYYFFDKLECLSLASLSSLV
jgi:hypothetical protein